MGSSELIKLVDNIGLSPSDAWALSSGGGGLRVHELDVDPYDFLVCAEEDYERGGNAAVLNAITNAKRAIVSQMDQALLSFGYPSTKWDIPNKIEALHGLGLITPRILRKVSGARNLLEHEYRRPEKNEVEEALDLASLFVASVKPILHMFGDEFYIGNRSEQLDAFTFTRQLCFSMSILKKPSTFRITAWVNCSPGFFSETGQLIGQTSLCWEDNLFPVVVRLAIATDRNFRKRKALADFCKEVCSPTGG